MDLVYNIDNSVDEQFITKYTQDLKNDFHRIRDNFANRWKIYNILSFVNDYNVNCEKMINLGCGKDGLGAYFTKFYNTKKCVLIDLLDRHMSMQKNIFFQNKLPTNGVEFRTEDYFGYVKTVPDEHFDIVVDLCAITHFNPKSTFCCNDGFYEVFRDTYPKLKKGGYFVVASDTKQATSFQETGLNAEFIYPADIIKYAEQNNYKTLNETVKIYNGRENDKYWHILFVVFQKL